MNEQEWLEAFDAYKDNFKWFFKDYFNEEVWTQLILLRENEDVVRMIALMNQVWFALPDGRFNIMEMPKGWSDFLFLIEQEMDYEHQEDPYDDPSTNDNLEQS